MAPKDSNYIDEARARAEAKRSHVSFPQLKYPSLRDDGFRDPALWLRGKALDDGAEGLWRVHGGLYDLTEFVRTHPGGRDWIELSEGTDITEAFESHHISESVQPILRKYYVRDAISPRNSPFTFHEDGFYRTFKAVVREKLKEIPKSVSNESDKITDTLFVALLVSSVMSCWIECLWLKMFPATIASLCLAWVTVCAHNYTHHKDNWRMYLYNLSLQSYRDFRISHALSHHQYPNTLLDWEISALEPLYPWLPRPPAGPHAALASPAAALLLQAVTFPFIFIGGFVKKLILVVTRDGFYARYWRWHDALGLALPAGMCALGGGGPGAALATWLAILLGGSFVFFCIALNAAHHHPTIFHDGDQVRSPTVDWGLHQLEAVMDRAEVNCSRFLVLTMFGDHALHHLLPTLDHAALPHLYPALRDLCRRHGGRFRVTTQLDLALGQIRQVGKTEPTLLREE